MEDLRTKEATCYFRQLEGGEGHSVLSRRRLVGLLITLLPLREEILMTKLGLFVTIEGVHGVGKTAISMMLTKAIQEQGYGTTYLNGQSGTPVGRELRKINISHEELAPLAEMLIVAAARHQSLKEIIRPNLEKGQFVICERFTDALLAYDFARETKTSIVKVISTAVADGTYPDLTIVLDLDPALALERIPKDERHRFEREDLGFHSRLREGYLELARKDPSRIKVIDGSGLPDSVFARVWTIASTTISEWKARVST